ncbi:MAG TPA: nicotinate-nucleotide adenylyltransferase [Longimicrobiaceae bacterium]|nr:nicotinate-nucleotide adenylyltransferase [Longimicrobiaceae bacterium]
MRIGVFGGTFDPPHHGHLIVAGDVHAALGLTRLLFVPAAVPPHKQRTVRASAGVRLEMVRAAIRGDDRFEVEDLELRRPGPSYTVDTLRVLRERFPGAEIFFLIGADNVPEIPSWREPEEILRLARLVAVPRGCEEAEVQASFPVLAVPVTRIGISATEIRRRVGAGECIRYLVPDAVREIISREGLYRDPIHSGKDPC